MEGSSDLMHPSLGINSKETGDTALLNMWAKALFSLENSMTIAAYMTCDKGTLASNIVSYSSSN
jgi:hypothetical protein